ncbi:hypothetical protein ACN20G_27795 (plasmid) [Streptomyces sp. BI20]
MSLLSRVQRFVRSPRGQRTITSARRAAADPRQRARISRLLSRLRTRR